MTRSARFPAPGRWLVLGLVLLGAVPAVATECVDWNDLPDPPLALETGADVQRLVRDGDLLYVGAAGRLLIADVSGPGAPVQLGELALTGSWCSDLAVSGTTVVVAQKDDAANGYYEPVVVDATDPAAPTIVGILTNGARNFDFAGDLLATACGHLGLQIVDLADPASPVVVGVYDAEAVDGRIVGRSGDCWVATPTRLGGVQHYDLGDPSAPAPTGRLSVLPVYCTNSTDQALALQGDVLYVVSSQYTYEGGLGGGTSTPCAASLAAVDVADPLVPALLSDVAMSVENPLDLAVDGDRALVGFDGAVRVVDVTDPGAPTLGERFVTPTAGTRGVAVDGARGFVGGAKLWLMDVAPDQPTPVLTAASGIGCATYERPLVSGDHLFLAGHDHAVVHDVTDPAAPAQVFYEGAPWGVGLKAVVGEYFYGFGSSIYQWTSGTALDCGCELPDATSILVKEVALYELGVDGGIWDVSDPAAPLDLGPLLSGRTLVDVAAAGGLAVAICTDALVVLDTDDPLAPIALATIPVTGYTVVRGALEDDVLAVACNDGLRFFDLRNRTAPSPAGFVVVANPVDVDLLGGIAYAASADEGSVAVAALPGETPHRLGAHRAHEAELVAHFVTGGGDLLAYYCGGPLVHLAQECRSVVPTLVTSFTARWENGRCRLEIRLSGPVGTLRVVARDARGERVLPWSSAGDARYLAEDAAWAGTADRSVTYVVQTLDADGSWIDLARRRTDMPALATELREPVPNPFNPATTISFELATGGPAELVVYGLDGKRVRTLIRGPLSAGPHAVTWDGTDDDGRALAAGVYLIRLETARTVASRKAALVK